MNRRALFIAALATSMLAGYVTDLMRYPDPKLTIIVITNLSDQHANARTIVRAVAPMFGQTLM